MGGWVDKRNFGPISSKSWKHKGTWENRGTQSKRVAVLLAGLITTQFFLFGPSLVGRKILLPLDILTCRDSIFRRASAPHSAPQTT